jgi:hypothetical protein
LAVVVAGIAQAVVAEMQIARLAQQDATAQYLAQAALEHQIFLLKDDKGTGDIADTNFPATADQRNWYRTTLVCLSNCSGNVEARRWRVTATGEIRRYNPDGTFVVLQRQTITADVAITYDGVSPLFGNPQRVTLLRWEETPP